MAFDRESPGYVDNLHTDKKDVNRTDQQGARALLGWRPGDRWDILLTGAWQETDLRDVGIADNDEGRLETNDRPRTRPNHTQYALRPEERRDGKEGVRTCRPRCETYT